ncbi:winged helix-turn-helix domain-containing protein [Caulobacter segnis]|uniref:winged helix-turn-helix domain-containing protein n=1 Tax=Caulobacter segnis TaxID=88688 RepID=UPI0024104CF2|nr:winged helix-turn-helix domain-containing protein [Caulobacter segnis]MDG2520450.1 winged helix-turn-helix domain-containing protein [Caulobacter segnis]
MSSGLIASGRSVAAFGPFEFHFNPPGLFEAGKPVALGRKALEIIGVLVDHAGDLVTRAELSASVWGGVTVVEAALRVHISAARKALRDGEDGFRFIVNEVGLGYRFVAPVAFAAPLRGLEGEPLLIGREDIEPRIAALIPDHRCLTLIGPLGVGKSALLRRVAQRRQWPLIDLARVDDEAGLLAAAAEALDCDADRQSLLSAVVDRGDDLLIFDNVEGALEPLAAVADAILGATRCGVLIGARAPLNIAGEAVLQTPCLEAPPLGPLRAYDAAKIPAMRLFVERADAATPGGFVLDDGNVEAAAELCRLLDGLPLAIEHAACALPGLGLRGLLEIWRSNQGWDLIERRGAQARHATLEAAFATLWSDLSCLERSIVLALADHPEGLPLTAIESRTAGGGATLLKTLVRLTACCIVQRQGDGDEPVYRLGNLLRLYALTQERPTPAQGAPGMTGGAPGRSLRAVAAPHR